MFSCFDRIPTSDGHTGRRTSCDSIVMGARRHWQEGHLPAPGKCTRLDSRQLRKSRGHVDARPLLHSLHWLPVRQQVTYKLAVLTHKERTTATPTYLSELVQTHAPSRSLCSSDAPTLVVPRIHTELASRAFSVAAPSTWNSLPADIRLCENILTFKRHLKTHLFKLT